MSIGRCPLLRIGDKVTRRWGDKEGKEVLKLGSWEDGKEGKTVGNLCDDSRLAFYKKPYILL